jgi:hypothetical protein
MPIELKIGFSSGPDTTVKVMNDANNQVFTFTFNRQPTSLVFDPNNNIVLKQATLTLGVPLSGVVPMEYNLHQNYPNPFNPVTTILYDIPVPSRVRLTVYDVLGRMVATVVNEEQQGGEYAVPFDGTHLSSGVYFYTLEAGKYVRTRSLILVK